MSNATPIYRTLASLLLVAASIHPLGAQSLDRKVVDEMGLWDTNPITNSSNENLLRDATTTALGHWGTDTPDKACDGIVEANNYWACETLPAWHQADLGSGKTIEALHIWPYWQDGRIYKYIIEGSVDGKTWHTLVDERANTIASTAEGNRYIFEPREVRYLKTTVRDSSLPVKGPRIVEIQAFAQAPKADMKLTAHNDLSRIDWTGDITAPVEDNNTLKMTGWRGERVNAQIAIKANQALQQLRFYTVDMSSKSGLIPLKARFVKFTKAKERPTSDIISNSDTERITNPNGVNRTIWVSIDIPATAKAGLYKGEVYVEAEGEERQMVPVTLEVQDQSLPAPKDWKIHLDLWQHAESIARWHDVELWSDEHFTIMKPLMQRLAEAGQKVITCTIIDEAWRGQTYDHYSSMVEWIKGEDGSMFWDYTNFDKYVTFMMEEIGIKNQISCYTMVPWSNKVRVLNDATGDYEMVDCIPGKASYDALWGDFIADFAKHIEEKGWADITGIALDERPDYMTKAAKKVLDKHGPKFKIISSVNSPSGSSDMVYDMSPALLHTDTITPELLAERKAAGKKTTFYVCCWPLKPNNFTQSPIEQSEWLGIFTAVNNLDGFLRWAYSSWNRNPFESTDFGTWQPGDCFLVYPGNRTSIRFEKMRDGFEEFEKLNILREQAKSNPELSEKLKVFESELAPLFNNKKTGEADYMKGVQTFRKGIYELSK